MEFGKMQQVSLREMWIGEASHFTPWLASNLALLGDVIGSSLTLESQESRVGMFRADIIAKDTDTGHLVLIENQLERTDHSHLGQIITYAAGLDALTVVWIAASFSDEHKAALDWLNKNTSKLVKFFGVEIELWKIDDSPVAPRFQIIASPNEWLKMAQSTRENAEHNGSPSERAKTFIMGFHERTGEYPMIKMITEAVGCSVGTASAQCNFVRSLSTN